MLNKTVYGKRLVYLDSAATTLKAKSVVTRMSDFYLHESANVHRGAHWVSSEATLAYEGARQKVCDFLGAQRSDEIVFTRGTTEAMNLLAASFGSTFLRKGDVILVSAMEHHSNLIPWQMLCRERGCELQIVPITDQGEIDLSAYRSLLSERVKLVSVVWCSNALGTVNPVAELIGLAHATGAKVVIDGAQAASTQDIDVTQLDCDFLAFSGHKLFGPYGVGVLYGKYNLLEQMPPYQGGGSMVDEVFYESFTYLPPPHRFEAGTPSIAEVIGLGAAIDYFGALNLAEVSMHEQQLLNQASRAVAEIEGLRIVGTAPEKISILSFVADFAHPSDLASILDREGVAVRAGHHCCQPLMRRLELPGTVRASFSIYNTAEDVEAFILAVKKAKELLT